MIRILFIVFCVLSGYSAAAQYKNDDVVYKTMYMEDIKILKTQSDFLLLDVRSPGEYGDTSRYVQLNMGRLKGAVNLTSREIRARVSELEKYKEKPVYVYCTHSMRSRAVSKFLAENGFKNVTNIRGGMHVANMFEFDKQLSLNEWVEQKTSYAVLSAPEALRWIKKKKALVVDVRPDSIFSGSASQVAETAYGSIRNSINIPFAELKNKINTLEKNRPVLVIDNDGNKSGQAAKLLAQNGFEAGVIVSGLDAWISGGLGKSKYLIRHHPYQLVSTLQLLKLINKNSPVILDVRTKAEFENKADQKSLNIGNVKNAINIPANELESKLGTLSLEKTMPIIVYGFSNDDNVFSSAQLLAKAGFTNVQILNGGLYNLRWEAHNVKDRAPLGGWIVNVPPDNF